MTRKSFLGTLLSAFAAAAVPFRAKPEPPWQAIRGLGSKSFRHLSASNRLKQRMLDSAYVEASLVLGWVPLK